MLEGRSKGGNLTKQWTRALHGNNMIKRTKSQYSVMEAAYCMRVLRTEYRYDSG